MKAVRQQIRKIGMLRGSIVLLSCLPLSTQTKKPSPSCPTTSWLAAVIDLPSMKAACLLVTRSYLAAAKLVEPSKGSIAGCGFWQVKRFYCLLMISLSHLQPSHSVDNSSINVSHIFTSTSPVDVCTGNQAYTWFSFCFLILPSTIG